MPIAQLASMGADMAGKAAGTALDLAQRAVSMVVNVTRFIVGILSSAFRLAASFILKFAGLIAGAAVGAVVGFITAIGTATKAAMDYARQVVDLRNSTGNTTGGALGLTQRFGAFNIGGEELSNGGQYFGLTQMIGKMFRANVSDPASINARSQSFGSGMMGHTMRQAFLKSIGLDSSQGRFLANLRPEKVREQMDFQQGMTAKMGVSPEVIRKLAEDLPLLINQVNIFKDLIIQKVAAVALPYATRAFKRLSDFLAANGDRIGHAIGAAVEWSLGKLEQLGSFLSQYWPAISSAIMKSVTWLWENAPTIALNGAKAVLNAIRWVSDGFFSLAHTTVNFLRVLENGNEGFGQFVGNFLKAVDSISVGASGAAQMLAGIGAAIYDFVSALSEVAAFIPNIILSLMKPIVDFVNKRGVAALKNIPGMGGVADLAAAANESFQNFSVPTLRSVTGVGFIDPRNAIADAQRLVPKTDLYGAWSNLQNSGSMGKFADNADAMLNKGQSWMNSQLGSADDFINNVAAAMSSQQAAKLAAEQLAEQKKSNQLLEKGNRLQEETGARIGGLYRHTVESVLTKVIQDSYLANAGY